MNKKIKALFLAVVISITADVSLSATQDVGVDNYLYVNANETTPSSYATFFFYRATPGTSGRIQFNLSWSGSAAQADFITTLPTSVILPSGNAAGTYGIEVNNDSSIEGTETLIVTVTSASNLDNLSETINVIDSGAGFYIYDDDKPTVFSVLQANGKETPQTVGKIRISRLTASTASALVVYYTLGGTATGPSPSMDYTIGVGGSSSVTIPIGHTYVDVEVIPWYDGYADQPETVILTLASNSAYSIGTGAATVTITDN